MMFLRGRFWCNIPGPHPTELHTSSFFLRLISVAVILPAAIVCADEPPSHPGAAVYTKVCADCHGQQGEGVKDEYDEPLIGERSLAALTKRIARTMPDDDPGSLSP